MMEENQRKDLDKYQSLNRDDLINSASRFTDLGFKVLPVNLNDHKNCNDYVSHVDRLSSAFLPYLFKPGVNMAIELGRHSKNLFVVVCNNRSDYETLCSSYPDYVKWVTTEGEKYNIWLLLTGGYIKENKQFGCYEVRGKGNNFMPPSVMPDGQFCVWMDREGNLPPAIGIEEIQKLFPNITIRTTKNLQQTGELRLHIKDENIRQLILIAKDMQWPGRDGPNLQKAYIAFCRRADLEGSACFRATNREIAILASISPSTAFRAREKLEKLNLIYRIEKKGNYFGLNFDHLVQSEIMPLVANCMLPCLNHDAFNYGALGASAGQILMSLVDKPQKSIKDIKKETGRGYSTVRSAIKDLSKAKLVCKTAGKWVANLPTSTCLKKIAEENGTLGNFKIRKHRINQERRNFAALQALWSTR
jgi:DNA-binding MarR family transcriptional regulator